ncbi:MAG: M23 family metallopeptidase [Bdellovibrionota bacterium]
MSFLKNKNNPFEKQKHKAKVDYYFHILHSPKKGITKSFKIHKSVPYIFCALLVLSFVGIGAAAKYCVNLNKSLAELEKINNVNRNLKGEIEALSLKIKNVELTVDQVENLSTKIRKASTRTDDRKDPTRSKNDGNIGGDALGIGPLSKEDYALSKELTGIKQDHLQLKNLFDEVDVSEAESSKKLVDFKKLMLELRKYNLKLQLMPDLSPAKGRLSSTYGWRMSPFSGQERMHLGLDIAAPVGTPIYATADGSVVRTAVTEDYGRMLEIQHTGKLLTRYAHTSMVYVKEGQKVKKGEIIAAVGSTGRSTGPHVHYEIEVDGKRIDPETYIVLW